MNKIEFKKTSNIFVNTGIVALHRYLKRFDTLEKHTFGEIKNELLPDKLIIENENLLELLEEVYYYMGREVYDTVTLEQEENVKSIKDCNLYYDTQKDTFIPFPRIRSYGFPLLLTNGRPKNTKKENNQKTLKKLREENKDLANSFIEEFKKNKLKLGSIIYFDEAYTTIPRLEKPKQEYFINDGIKARTCALTGEEYKKLININNNSPFIKLQGIQNFSSFFNTSSLEISWKSMFVIRFSPTIAMYSYFKGSDNPKDLYDNFITFFLNSNNLVNINSLYSDEFFYTIDELKHLKPPFKRNCRFASFKYSKDHVGDINKNLGDDAFNFDELTFILIYSFFKKHFENEFDEIDVNSANNPFTDFPFEKIPISLIILKTKAFGRSKSMMPEGFEEFNNVKFLIRLFYHLETNPKKRISINELWNGLKITLPKYKDKKPFAYSRARAERLIRVSTISKILRGKSCISDITNLFIKSFLILTASKDNNPGYRKYDLLTEFVKIYEPIIKFGGIKMDKNLQQKAINLGESIGDSIITLDNPKNEMDKISNAKYGRKYIIGLHKARTITQFRDALIRIQRKYGVSIANDIIENLNENNYIAIKQYAQIGALNTLNTFLSNQSKY